VRTALQDAASVAGLLITIQAMVAARPENAAPGGAGMGEMGGMASDRTLRAGERRPRPALVPSGPALHADDRPTRASLAGSHGRAAECTARTIASSRPTREACHGRPN
jgi:hypothetical protein